MEEMLGWVSMALAGVGAGSQLPDTLPEEIPELAPEPAAPPESAGLETRPLVSLTIRGDRVVLREGGAEAFEYPPVARGRGLGPVLCHAKLRTDAGGRPARLEVDPGGCPKPFADAVRAGAPHLRLSSLDPAVGSDDVGASLDVRFSEEPAGAAAPLRLLPHEAFHFPPWLASSSDLPTVCALRLHVSAVGRPLEIEPAPAGCSGLVLEDALRDAATLRFAVPAGAPVEGWRFDLQVRYHSESEALQAHGREAERERKLRPLPPDGAGGGAGASLPPELPPGGQGRVDVFLPARPTPELDGAVMYTTPEVHGRNLDERFRHPAGLGRINGPVACEVAVWHDGEGRPVHLEPVPDQCPPLVELEALAGVWTFEFEPLRLDGQVVPLAQTVVRLRFLQD